MLDNKKLPSLVKRTEVIDLSVHGQIILMKTCPCTSKRTGSPIMNLHSWSAAVDTHTIFSSSSGGRLGRSSAKTNNSAVRLQKSYMLGSIKGLLMEITCQSPFSNPTMENLFLYETVRPILITWRT